MFFLIYLRILHNIFFYVIELNMRLRTLSTWTTSWYLMVVIFDKITQKNFIYRFIAKSFFNRVVGYDCHLRVWYENKMEMIILSKQISSIPLSLSVCFRWNYDWLKLLFIDIVLLNCKYYCMVFADSKVYVT